jgi:hypothetical protein
METKEYRIRNLELYVYLLNESEMKKLQQSKNSAEINSEIISIEKLLWRYHPVFLLSLSGQLEKIKEKLELKHANVIQMEPSSNRSQYMVGQQQFYC